MDVKFLIFTEQLHEKYLRLIRGAPISVDQLPKKEDGSGVYTFTENGKVIYVGRTRNVKQRFGQHTNDGSLDNQAVLAFKFAKQLLGIPAPTYKDDEHSRKNLMKNDVFRAVFLAQKRRLRLMEFRFVEENDPVKQALLEIYASVVCESPYNDFKTT